MVHHDIYRGGKRLVSVTELQTVMAKPFLDKWRLKLCMCKAHINHDKDKLKPHERVIVKDGFCGYHHGDILKDAAGDLGNEVHEIIETWFGNGVVESANEEAAIWADKIVQIYKDNKVEPYLLKPEQNLIDEESGLAGSPDHVILWNGEPCIADLKIKNSLDANTIDQGIGYQYLIKRLKGVHIKKMLVMWCKKKTVNKLVEPVWFDLDEGWEDWKALVRRWNKANPSRKVNILE